MLAVVSALSLASLTAAGMGGTPAAFAQSTVHAKAAARHTSGSVVRLQETGSTLLFPLFQLWVPEYRKVAPNVQITPTGTGSGTGIQQAEDGVVQIGASDAYMSVGQLGQHPSMLNIPLAISAQQIMVHLPGLKASEHLHLTGAVIAQMFMGNIRYWNAPQIQKLNRGVKLPHALIVPVHRTDSSGDTFLFSQFMTDTNAKWAQSVGFNTSVPWPAVAGALGGNGNQGVVQTAVNTPYSIAYVGISWLDKALSHGLGEVALANRAGRFLLPTTATISAAAGQMIGKTPRDERISLIYAPGANSYPIINYEYAIVNEKQSSAAVAQAIKNLLFWAIGAKGGNSGSFMTKVHFLPLPASIAPLSRAQIERIHG
ncbi:MAG: phosphate ABC transporter substrate-binding protein PstS [Bacilli bacterium]